MLLIGISAPAVPALLKPLLDEMLTAKELATMSSTPFLLIALFFVQGILNYIGQFSLAWANNKMIQDIQMTIFSKLLIFSSDYHHHHTAASLASKITQRVAHLKDAIGGIIPILLRDSITIVCILIWMFYVNWEIALISIIGLPTAFSIALIFRKRLRKLNRLAQLAGEKVCQVADECTKRHQIIKLFDANSYEEGRFYNITNHHRHYATKSAAVAAINAPLMQLIGMTTLAIVLYVIVQQAIAGELIGNVVAFFAALIMLYRPVGRVFSLNQSLQMILTACENIFELLDSPEAEPDTGQHKLRRVRGEIEFCNVSFRYEGMQQNALNHISLHINSGESIALIGRSGGGKTTIANLLSRFYQISEGEILLDGKNINDITLKSLRKNISLVSQNTMLFQDTVRNNIAYGELRNSSEADIIRAAKAAHALEFIEALPDGFDTLLGAGGVELSGGQQQRISIARALLKDPPILILDEATSSLDIHAEQHIQKALHSLKVGRTCLIIAHRFSTIKSADRIAVIEQGSILETGTYSTIIKKFEADIWKLQNG